MLLFHLSLQTQALKSINNVGAGGKETLLASCPMPGPKFATNVVGPTLIYSVDPEPQLNRSGFTRSTFIIFGVHLHPSLMRSPLTFRECFSFSESKDIILHDAE